MITLFYIATITRMDGNKRKKIDLSIIVPALNEEAVIESTLSTLSKLIKKELLNYSVEVVVVAAKDKDKTAEIAENSQSLFKNFQLLTPNSKLGKGRDVSLGFMAANGSVRIFTDADLAIPVTNIKPMFLELLSSYESGGDLALFGSRTEKHGSIIRKFFSYASSLTTRILFFSNLHDMQCGFKGFTKGAADIGFGNLQTTGWAFDSEVYVRLKKARIAVKPFTITEWSSDTHHLGGQNILKASIQSFFELLKIRVKSLFY